MIDHGKTVAGSVENGYGAHFPMAKAPLRSTVISCKKYGTKGACVARHLTADIQHVTFSKHYE